MTPQAHVSDLPGWPCPTRVRDIVTTRDSWGWIPVIFNSALRQQTVWYDELGALWVDGDAIPRFRGFDDAGQTSPGAIVYWTPTGIGLYIHPSSYAHLPDRTRLENTEAESWIPVAVVGDKPPVDLPWSGLLQAPSATARNEPHPDGSH